MIREQVEQPVRALANLADALLQREQQRLAPEGQALRGQRHPVKLRAAQAADEGVTLPVAEAPARVERQTARRDAGRPVQPRILHARRRRACEHRPESVAGPCSAVGPPVGDHWPAEIAAGFHDVDLIPAQRAVIDAPQRPCAGMHRHSRRVAYAEGVDFGVVTRFVDERIVGGHGAIVVEAQDLARVRGRVLRLPGAADAVGAALRPQVARRADAHVQFVVGAERDTHRARAAGRGIGDEHILDIAESVGAVVPAARHRGGSRGTVQLVPVRIGFAGQAPGIREVHPPVVGVPGVQRHVHQALVGRSQHGGDAGDGLRIEREVRVHAPQAARPLGHQHRPAGKEGQGPGALQALERGDPQALAFLVDDLRGVGERVRTRARAARYTLAWRVSLIEHPGHLRGSLIDRLGRRLGSRIDRLGHWLGRHTVSEQRIQQRRHRGAPHASVREHDLSSYARTIAARIIARKCPPVRYNRSGDRPTKAAPGGCPVGNHGCKFAIIRPFDRSTSSTMTRYSPQSTDRRDGDIEFSRWAEDRLAEDG